ncbi:MAG TPA: heavy metal-associated domain-containing protein [Bacteroidetes bacterium]|nr:heavy metal-associated domain-containing protein [Bacteroidota bacterium]
MDYAREFLNELYFITTEMAPYLLLGFFFAGVLYLLFPKKKVRQYMGRNRTGAVVNASILGIPLPLCSCGVIPTGLSFYRNGASRGSTVSFLISTPQTGIDSILVTYSMLGLPFALIRPFIALFTGISGGLLTNRLTKREKEKEISVTDNNNTLPSGFFPKIKAMFRYAFVEFLQDIMGWLIIGLLIAALIAVFVPDDFFAGRTGNDILEMFIILIAAVPVYICATASVPIAAVLMLKGLSPGAALVLLMAGPATNAATITMIGKVMGRKSLLAYLVSIISGALVFGFLINTFMPERWFALPQHMMIRNHEMLPGWLSTGSAVILVLLIINGYMKRFFGNTKDKTTDSSPVSGTNIITMKVSGMTCNHCKSSVENATSSVEGVESAVADLAKGSLAISGKDIDIEKIRSNIRAAGYETN